MAHGLPCAMSALLPQGVTMAKNLEADRQTEGFDDTYSALQNSQDIASALEHVRNLRYPVADYTGAFVKLDASGADYAEIWVSVWGFPWGHKAAWHRVR